MSTEGNKTAIRRLFTEVFGEGDMDALGDLLSTDVLGHDPTSREPRRGSESVKQVAVLLRTAFPDARFPIYDLITEGDKVVARWDLQGTRQAEFMGIPATGRSRAAGAVRRGRPALHHADMEPESVRRTNPARVSH